MKRLAAAILPIIVGVLIPFAACSDGRVTSSAAVDAAADATMDAPHVDQSASGDSGPDFNSDGWVRVGFDQNCEFYAAPSADRMPTPIEWEPCSSTALSLGFACRQIKITWPASALGVQMAQSPSGWVDGSGKAWLATSRLFGKTVLKFVAEVDGAVHLAVTHQTGRCSLPDASLRSGRAVFHAVRQNSQGVDEQNGAIGGSVDALPLVLESWPDAKSRSFIAGPNSYFALGADNVIRPYAAGGASLGTVTVTDPGQMGAIQFVGDELFYQVHSLSYSRIKVYSLTAGARDLISFGNDVSANAADFGTDGVDMVWTEAFGRTSSSDPWTTINIMTSKFTADPSKIVKRRLRSESRMIGAAPFKVGCGYAAHDISADDIGTGTRLVRLSDGRSWRFIKTLADGGPTWTFLGPLAITCDELFVNVIDGKENRVARIRIDSLGEGEPAD